MKRNQLLIIFTLILGGLFCNQAMAWPDDYRPTCEPTATKACLIHGADHDEFYFLRLVNGSVLEKVLDVPNCTNRGTGNRSSRGTTCYPYTYELNGVSLEIITRDGNTVTFNKDSGKTIITSDMTASVLTTNGWDGYIFETELGERSQERLENYYITSTTNKRRRPFELTTVLQELTFSRNTRRANVTRTDAYTFLGLSTSDHYELTAESNKLVQVKVKFINLPDVNGSTPVTPTPTPGGGNSGVFEIAVDGRTFNIEPQSSSIVAALRAQIASPTSTNNRIGGFVLTSQASYNTAWNFHLDPSAIELFSNGDAGYDVTCDAGPDMIERNLADVGSFDFLFDTFWCPLSSQVIREL